MIPFQRLNKHRSPHTDMTSEELQLVSSLNREQFLELCEDTRPYEPTATRHGSLCHEAELLLYLWR